MPLIILPNRPLGLSRTHYNEIYICKHHQLLEERPLLLKISLSKTLPQVPRRDKGWMAGTRKSDAGFKDHSSGSKLQVSGSKKTRNLHPSCSHEVRADHDDSFLVAQTVKNPPAMWETWVRSLGQEDPWKRARQPTPVFLPGESPWTEEPGGLQSMGSQGVGHDWGTKHKHVMRRQT